jgi:hypothetical protein
MLNFIHYFHLKLRCDERFTHAFAFSKKLPWLAQTKVITLKTQLHAVNARWKRLSQLSFKVHPISTMGNWLCKTTCVSTYKWIVKLTPGVNFTNSICKVHISWLMPYNFTIKIIPNSITQLELNPNFNVILFCVP